MYNEEMELKSMTGVRGSWLIIKDGTSFDVEFSSGKPRRNYITQRQLAAWLAVTRNRSVKKEIYPKCDYFLYQYGRETDFSSKIILPNKEIIVPSKEIKTSIAVVNDTLLEKAKQNPISVGLVRAFYGIVSAEAATAGVFITTSRFTRPAQEFTRNIKHQMALKDYDDLVQELNNIKF